MITVPWYHYDPTLWPDVEDPALEHPMSPRMVQIMETYRRLHKETGKIQPLLKPARYAFDSNSSNIVLE
jgi:transaldolase